MTEIEAVIQSIPIRHNGFTYIMFSGALLGLVLSVAIVSRWRSSSHSTKLLCVILLCMTLVLADLALSYSGIMKYMPHLIDTSEFLVILIIPFVYFIVLSINERREFILRKDWIHLVIPAIYLLGEAFFFIQPAAFKINALIDAFHPALARVRVDTIIPVDPTGLRGLHREIIFATSLIYIILIFKRGSTFNLQSMINTLQVKSRKLVFVRNIMIITFVFLIFIFYVFSTYEHDQGDHFIGIFISYIIFATAYFIINESRIFEESWIADKYETSGFTEKQDALISEIKSHLEASNAYLEAGINLKQIAKDMDVSANYISQAINTSEGINFNEFINSYRVSESKLRLKDDDYTHLSIEGIGQSVGFKSKSSFYAAFKKQTGMTPKVFQKSITS